MRGTSLQGQIVQIAVCTYIEEPRDAMKRNRPVSQKNPAILTEGGVFVSARGRITAAKALPDAQRHGGWRVRHRLSEPKALIHHSPE